MPHLVAISVPRAGVLDIDIGDRLQSMRSIDTICIGFVHVVSLGICNHCNHLSCCC